MLCKRHAGLKLKKEVTTIKNQQVSHYSWYNIRLTPNLFLAPPQRPPPPSKLKTINQVTHPVAHSDISTFGSSQTQTMDYCVSLFSLLCLESSCPSVCPLSRCERLLHNKYRKGVSLHPGEKQPSVRDFADLFEPQNLGSCFFLLAPFFAFHLTWHFLPRSCCVISAKPRGAFCETVAFCLSGLLERTLKPPLGIFSCYSAKP